MNNDIKMKKQNTYDYDIYHDDLPWTYPAVSMMKDIVWLKDWDVKKGFEGSLESPSRKASAFMKLHQKPTAENSMPLRVKLYATLL